ncbi:hypothetical protein SteCoe_1991 [Stentor coeruleus]|uniref:Uncharacterized protein n=1 Tax=Stentor coeruleus TaxID=5963 RepID=A0A1R2D0L3_9CILI|nr:hypothetical protein SteCoe_1991 [Stentor coeruleus]
MSLNKDREINRSNTSTLSNLNDTENNIQCATCTIVEIQKALNTFQEYLKYPSEHPEYLFLKFGNLVLSLNIKQSSLVPKTYIANSITSSFQDYYTSFIKYQKHYEPTPAEIAAKDYLKENYAEFTSDFEDNIEKQMEYAQKYWENCTLSKKSQRKNKIPPIQTKPRDLMKNKKTEYSTAEDIEKPICVVKIQNFTEKLNIEIEKLSQIYCKKIIGINTEPLIEDQITQIKQEITELTHQLSSALNHHDKDAVLMEISRKNTKLNELRTENALKLSHIRRQSYSKLLSPRLPSSKHNKTISNTAIESPICPSNFSPRDSITESSEYLQKYSSNSSSCSSPTPSNSFGVKNTLQNKNLVNEVKSLYEILVASKNNITQLVEELINSF